MRAKFYQIKMVIKALFRNDRYISFCDMSRLCAPLLDDRGKWLKAHLIALFRRMHNRRFLKRAKRQSFYCADRLLDKQQIEAVVACEDAQLVLASAGSGKTLSLLAKIEYLHNQLKIPARHILVVSFTQKTVAELKERCSIGGVEIRTFHGLGNHLLRSTRQTAMESKQLVAEVQIGNFIRNYCEFLISRDADFARDFVNFVLFYYPFSVDKFAIEEQRIADWLYIHGLDFVHNYQYPFLGQKYLVSFAIKTPHIIYIDYLVIDQKGRSPYGREYLRDAKWRTKLHAKHGTNYIILPSWRWLDCSMFDYFEAELKKYRIMPRRLPDVAIREQLLKNEKHAKNLDSFYRMLQSFLLLHKNGMYRMAEITERLRGEEKYVAIRNALFQRIYARIYNAYAQFLFKTRQYDFADMINAAKRQVEDAGDCARGYEYILLDEVQDLSRNRLLLIRAILRKNPGCKLFAVGDDWQSIYRFAGSDLTLIRDFDQIFSLATRRSFIETTHRFGQPTIRISCDFIQRNPAQSCKMVKNSKRITTPIYVIFNKQTKQNTGQDAESLQMILQNIIAQLGIDAAKQKSLQIIARYNCDISRLESKLFKIIPHRDSADIFDVV